MHSSKTCSFCQHSNSMLEIHSLLDGQLHICDPCLSYYGQSSSSPERERSFQMKPVQVKAALDEWIIGQEEAKMILAMNVYQHQRKMGACQGEQKSHVLLVGNSGTGKTYLIQQLAKLLDVPLVIADATTLTEAGFEGESVDSLILRLYLKAEQDMERAERGIIFIDEVDKLAAVTSDSYVVGRKGVQEALLRMMEGDEVMIEVGQGSYTRKVIVDTRGVLFVFGGAFVGMEDEESPYGGIGFHSKEKTHVSTGIPSAHRAKALVSFGLIPEFVNRIPIHIQLDPLGEADLLRILQGPHSILAEYRAFLEQEGIALEVEPALLQHVAQEAYQSQMGARGLRLIMEKMLLRFSYQVLSSPPPDGVMRMTVDGWKRMQDVKKNDRPA